MSEMVDIGEITEQWAGEAASAEFLLTKTAAGDPCPNCGGTGQARHPVSGQYTAAPCPTCRGTGQQLTEAGAIGLAATGEITKEASMNKRKNPNRIVKAMDAIAADSNLTPAIKERAGEFATRMKLRARRGEVIKALDGYDFQQAQDIITQAAAAYGGGDAPTYLDGVLGAAQAVNDAQQRVLSGPANAPTASRGQQIADIMSGATRPLRPEPSQPSLDYATKELEAAQELARTAVTPLEKQRAGDLVTQANLRLLNIRRGL